MKRAVLARLVGLARLAPLAGLVLVAGVASVSISPLAMREAAAEPPVAKLPPSSWEGALPLSFARPAKACSAVRLGEWARVTCKVEQGMDLETRVIGGSAEGVVFREKKPDGVEILLRLGPGDRREIAISAMTGGGKYTFDATPLWFLSELWLPGEAEPTFALAVGPE